MTIVRKFTAIVTLLLMWTFAWPLSLAIAKTTVSTNGTEVTITVPIDLVGLGSKASVRNPDTGETTELVSYFENGVEAIWNAGFKSHKYQDCLTFKLDLQISLVSRRPSLTDAPEGGGLSYFDFIRPGYHELDYYSSAPNAFFWDPDTEALSANEDTTSAYTQSLMGMTPDIDDLTFAHEVGHLMGLGDDYHRSGPAKHHPLEGRDGTLMAIDGLTIDQAIVDRIGKLIEHEGLPLPACACPSGPMSAEVLNTLRWAVLTGTYRYHFEEEQGKKDPNTSIGPKHREDHYVDDETLKFSFRGYYRPGTNDSKVTFGHRLTSSWERSEKEDNIKDGKAESHAFSSSGSFKDIDGSLTVLHPMENLRGSYVVRFDRFEYPPDDEENRNASGVGFGGRYSYSPARGRPDGNICADGTLRGAGQKTEGGDEWVTKWRGGDFEEKHRTIHSWSWTIRMAPADPPAHAVPCDKAYDAGKLSSAIIEFMMGHVSRAAYSNPQALYGSGRVDDVAAMSSDFMSVEKEIKGPKETLGELESSLRRSCGMLDDNWISNAPEADAEYKKNLDEFEKDLAAWDSQLRVITDRLASKTERLAEKLKPLDPAAAGKVHALASKVRKEGLEGFAK